MSSGPAPTGWRRIAAAFSETAENYAVSMAPSTRGMALAVVQRAMLASGEQILDIGTGTGIAAAAALSADRGVVGVDAAQGMLAIARREVPGARFVEADFAALPFKNRSFNVVISVHALHFAADPVAVLAEWRRVTTSGGRLSLSVPGPRAALSMNLYDPIYARHGMKRRIKVPSARKLTAWAKEAGWRDVRVHADPDTVIRLAGPNVFDLWMRTGSRADAREAMGAERFAALEADLVAVTPRSDDGQLLIPFGTLYLTARNM